MVRQYSSSFRPTWAANSTSTLPSQNSHPLKSEASNIKISEREEILTPRISLAPSAKDDLLPSGSGASSLRSKPSILRSYSKFYPSSWTLPRKPSPPPTKVIDFGNQAGSSGGYTNIQQPLPPRDLRRHNFSAASGEGDVAPRPPEGFYAATYSTPMNAMAFERHHEAPYPNVPNLPVSGTVPWEPWHTDLAVMNAPHIGYGEPPESNVTPCSTASTSSATNDVPARAPHVSSGYSATSIN